MISLDKIMHARAATARGQQVIIDAAPSGTLVSVGRRAVAVNLDNTKPHVARAPWRDCSTQISLWAARR